MKDIQTNNKHKFSSLWDGPFIVVDIVATWAYVIAEVNGNILTNTYNIDQLHKYYV
jgi:hypothetical protein